MDRPRWGSPARRSRTHDSQGRRRTCAVCHYPRPVSKRQTMRHSLMRKYASKYSLEVDRSVLKYSVYKYCTLDWANLIPTHWFVGWRHSRHCKGAGWSRGRGGLPRSQTCFCNGHVQNSPEDNCFVRKQHRRTLPCMCTALSHDRICHDWSIPRRRVRRRWP